LKILRGIFLKNVFRGWGQPAGVLGDETGFERAHRADISPPDVFFFQLVQPVSSVGSFKPCLKVQISNTKHSAYHDQTQREEVARMAKAARSSEKVPKSRAALTPEAREKQLIALAIDVAEEQMRNGTASSQVISHFLKLGSTRAQIEKELLEKQRDLAAAKAEAIESSAKMEDLYLKAAKAMKSYQGQEDEEDEY
jgi:hypothetical protein